MSNASPKQRRSSRLPGFYQRPLPERAAVVANWAGLDRDEQAVLTLRILLADLDIAGIELELVGERRFFLLSRHGNRGEQNCSQNDEDGSHDDPRMS